MPELVSQLPDKGFSIKGRMEGKVERAALYCVSAPARLPALNKAALKRCCIGQTAREREGERERDRRRERERQWMDAVVS